MTLTVRLDDGLHHELTNLSRSQGMTLSELTRRTLSALVRPDDDESRLSPSGETPVALTTLDRHMLATLHRILGYLVDGKGPDGDLEYQHRLAEILDRGYVAEYGDVFIGVERELSRAESAFVMDVLDMFDRLEWSYERLDVRAKKALGSHASYSVHFRGFDLNDRLEGRYHSFARYLIDSGRWERLAVYFDDQHERGNSHFPTLEVYSRMLEEFNPLWREKVRAADYRVDADLYALTAEEVRRVTDAAIHPDNRR